MVNKNEIDMLKTVLFFNWFYLKNQYKNNIMISMNDRKSKGIQEIRMDKQQTMWCRVQFVFLSANFNFRNNSHS